MPFLLVELLDALSKPAVLVVMHGDNNLPGSSEPSDLFEKKCIGHNCSVHRVQHSVSLSNTKIFNRGWADVLQHKMLAALFSMNAMVNDAKVFGIPIGMQGGMDVVMHGYRTNHLRPKWHPKELLLLVNARVDLAPRPKPVLVKCIWKMW